MSITTKSQTENSEEYLNKLLSLSNDDYLKLTKQPTSTKKLKYNSEKDNTNE